MIVKVCGLKDPKNIVDIAQTKPNMMGFIFAAGSSRRIEKGAMLIDIISKLKAEKVGVFVNEDVENIREIMSTFKLTTVQLHGDESPSEIALLKNNFKVTKAFSVDDDFDFRIDQYAAADMYLFDAKGSERGGNGTKFNWTLLENYTGSTPFLLSGGIQLEDIKEIKKISHPMFAGIDVNSGFEDFPGIKNVADVNELLKNLK